MLLTLYVFQQLVQELLKQLVQLLMLRQVLR